MCFSLFVLSIIVGPVLFCDNFYVDSCGLCWVDHFEIVSRNCAICRHSISVLSMAQSISFIHGTVYQFYPWQIDLLAARE